MDGKPATHRGAAFARALEGRVGDILTNCTACGKCVEACPMTGPARVNARNPEAVAAGVLRVLETGHGPADSLAWLEACSLSGACIAACAEGINPRFMVIMARIARLRAATEAGAMRHAGKAAFAKVARGVRMLSRLQLGAAELARLGQMDGDEQAQRKAELVFYIGCNLLRMPHIALLCIDVLEALGVDYQVVGGPGQCCGIPHFRAGDTETAGRVAFNTLRHAQSAEASDFVCWCPSCGRQFGEIVLPAFAATGRAMPFEISMFAVYLERRLEALRPLLIHPVEKRVGVHEHPGLAGVGRAVRNLLQAIPGLHLVDLAQPELGAMCSDFLGSGEVRERADESLLAAAREAEVTTLAGIYHSCHGRLCHHQADWPFEVVNFMELIGQSMGIFHRDTFKHIKLARDADAAIEEAGDLIESHGLDPAEARREVTEYILGG